MVEVDIFEFDATPRRMNGLFLYWRLDFLKASSFVYLQNSIRFEFRNFKVQSSKFKFKFPRARTYEMIGLVLGCIEAKFCKWILLGNLLPRSTRCTPLHRFGIESLHCSLLSKFSLEIADIFAEEKNKICKLCQNCAKFWPKCFGIFPKCSNFHFFDISRLFRAV